MTTTECLSTAAWKHLACSQEVQYYTTPMHMVRSVGGGGFVKKGDVREDVRKRHHFEVNLDCLNLLLRLHTTC